MEKEVTAKPWQAPFEPLNIPCHYRHSGEWQKATLVHGPWVDWATIEADGRILVVRAADVYCDQQWTPRPAAREWIPAAIGPDATAAAVIAMLRQECERLTAENARLRKELANISSS